MYAQLKLGECVYAKLNLGECVFKYLLRASINANTHVGTLTITCWYSHDFR